MMGGLKYLSEARLTRLFLAVLLATLAFTLWGYVWYATLLDDVWQDLIGQSEQGLIDVAAQRGALQTFLIYFISLVQVIGLWWVIRVSGQKSFFGYQFAAAVCSVLIAAPVLGNAVLFANSPLLLWLIDLGHFVSGYAGIALTLWLVDVAMPAFYASRADR